MDTSTTPPGPRSLADLTASELLGLLITGSPETFQWTMRAMLACPDAWDPVPSAKDWNDAGAPVPWADTTALLVERANAEADRDQVLLTPSVLLAWAIVEQHASVRTRHNLTARWADRLQAIKAEIRAGRLFAQTTELAHVWPDLPWVLQADLLRRIDWQHLTADERALLQQTIIQDHAVRASLNITAAKNGGRKSSTASRLTLPPELVLEWARVENRDAAGIPDADIAVMARRLASDDESGLASYISNIKALNRHSARATTSPGRTSAAIILAVTDAVGRHPELSDEERHTLKPLFEQWTVEVYAHGGPSPLKTAVQADILSPRDAPGLLQAIRLEHPIGPSTENRLRHAFIAGLAIERLDEVRSWIPDLDFAKTLNRLVSYAPLPTATEALARRIDIARQKDGPWDRILKSMDERMPLLGTLSDDHVGLLLRHADDDDHLALLLGQAGQRRLSVLADEALAERLLSRGSSAAELIYYLDSFRGPAFLKLWDHLVRRAPVSLVEWAEAQDALPPALGREDLEPLLSSARRKVRMKAILLLGRMTSPARPLSPSR